MAIHTCKKCKKIFDHKVNYEKHLNRRKPCSYDSKTNKTGINNICKKCGKDFSRKDSLTRHLQVCKVKINKNNIKGNNNNNNNNNNINIKNSNNKTINKNPITINLILFTKDGIEDLGSKDLKKIFRMDRNLIETIIETVNFNPAKPQNHNVYYPNLSSAYGVVYENKKWVFKKISEILNMLLDAKIEDLNELLNDFDDCFSKKMRNKIKETIENATYSKPDKRKKLISYLKPILYNNKDMVIKTRKLIDNLKKNNADDNDSDDDDNDSDDDDNDSDEDYDD